MSTNQCTDKENVVHMCHAAIKKDEILSFVTTWLEMRIIMLSEIEKQELHDLTHVWTLREFTS